MSTKLQTGQSVNHIPRPYSGRGFSCVVITAEWNSSITHALRQGALDTLAKAGVEDDRIVCLSVPGAVELTHAAAKAIEILKPSAVIILGCVIRGDTPHFDYVCESVTQGVTILNTSTRTPVIFGLLTVENFEQAQERAGGKLGNKGAECAEVAITMANLDARLDDGLFTISK